MYTQINQCCFAAAFLENQAIFLKNNPRVAITAHSEFVHNVTKTLRIACRQVDAYIYIVLHFCTM